MTAAYRQVAEALVSGADGESAWSRRQRSILLACETGLATARQRRQAEEMLAVDPRCRATLAELRVALRDVAAVLPFPAAVEEERTRRLLESLVDGVDRLLPGGRRAARQVAESVAPSGAAEPVTAGAVALGAGGAAKVALACLAAGGTAAVCLTIATPSTTRPEIAKPVPRAERPTRVVVRDTRPPSLSVPAAASKPEPRTTAPRKRRSRPETETPVSSKQSQPAVSPAPAGSTEFGPGALGSAQASVRGSTCHPGRRRC